MLCPDPDTDRVGGVRPPMPPFMDLPGNATGIGGITPGAVAGEYGDVATSDDGEGYMTVGCAYGDGR